MILKIIMIFVFSCVLARARGQYFDDPAITFAPVEFEWVRRGNYNMSYCSSELINCWEMVKPDTMCNYLKYYDSVCSQIREYCDDVLGDQEEYWHVYRLREVYCKEWWLGVYRLWGTLHFEDGIWTRRMTRALRARRLAIRRRSALGHTNSTKSHVNSVQGHTNSTQGHVNSARGYLNSATLL